MKETNKITNILKRNFQKPNKTIEYFNRMIQKFEQRDWESTLVQSGKFVETVIKSILFFAGQSIQNPRKLKMSDGIQKICNSNKKQIPSNGIRLQVPRACKFLYDVTSNRGGRHDTDECDPNEMDATIAVGLCSWILAEMIRFCMKNKISPDEAQNIVKSLIERRYPIFEKIEDRIYIDRKKHTSTTQCALMILYYTHPKRIQKKDLIADIKRNGYKKSSINLSRLSPFTDQNNKGIYLRGSGRKEVERILNRNSAN